MKTGNLARIAMFTGRHFISSDFTSPCQRQVNRQPTDANRASTSRHSPIKGAARRLRQPHTAAVIP